MTPAQLCDPRHQSLRTLLEKAIESAREQGEDERELVGLEEQDDLDEDGGVGSASDSDEAEAYQKEQERRRREGKGKQ